jgi:O-antigen/teichoic acid export membrane protein
LTTVFATFIFLNVVYQYGMESAYLKFASDADHGGTGGERATVFSTSIWSLLATSIVLSALLLLLRHPVGQLIGLSVPWRYLLNYVAAILILDTVVAVPFAELRLSNQPKRFAVIKLINVGVNVALNVVLITQFGLGIEAVFIANLVASATSLLLLLPNYVRLLRPSFDLSLWRELLLFGLPFIPGGLGYAFSDRVNLFFLQKLTPDRLAIFAPPGVDGASVDADYLVGLFSGGTKIAVLMALVVQMFRYAWQPFFLQHSRDSDATTLFARVFGLFVAACLFVGLGVSFFAQELVELPLPGGRNLIDPSFYPGLVIVPVLLLGYVFQGMYYNFSAGAYITKRTRYFATCAVLGAIVAVTANAFLVPRYGMYGAAWATTAAYITMAVSLHWFVHRAYPVPYPWAKVGLLFAVAGGVYYAWANYTALQIWYFEMVLLIAYLAAVFGTGIVRWQWIRQLRVSRK